MAATRSVRMTTQERQLYRHYLSEVWPDLGQGRFKELVESMETLGFDPSRPITVLAGTDEVLDGWSRYNAANVAGVEPIIVEYEGDDPIGYVIAMNAARRHTSAMEIATAVAKCRNWQGVGRPASTASDVSDADRPRTNAELAREAGTSESTMERARRAIRQEQQGEAEQPAEAPPEPAEQPADAAAPPAETAETPAPTPEPQQQPEDAADGTTEGEAAATVPVASDEADEKADEQAATPPAEAASETPAEVEPATPADPDAKTEEEVDAALDAELAEIEAVEDADKGPKISEREMQERVLRQRIAELEDEKDTLQRQVRFFEGQQTRDEATKAEAFNAQVEEIKVLNNSNARLQTELNDLKRENYALRRDLKQHEDQAKADPLFVGVVALDRLGEVGGESCEFEPVDMDSPIGGLLIAREAMPAAAEVGHKYVVTMHVHDTTSDAGEVQSVAAGGEFEDVAAADPFEA